jgi:3-phenylpropionate/trans-cinnamate dioxygenase ferredoxin reductase component
MPGMVIVGGGECGARAAFALREGGYTGPITLIGDETELPYERPPLSKTPVGGRIAPKTIAEAPRYAEAGIATTLGGAAQAIDRTGRAVLLADGSRIPYERLLIATGAQPRRLPLAEGRPVAYLRTVADARRILAAVRPGGRVAIVGAGFIGLELAATLRGVGAAVTVLEAAPRVLGRAVLPEIAAVLAARHAAEGVEIRTGVQIEAIEANTVTLADGSRVAADLVVIGIGAVPATGLAERAGLAVDNGVAVDATLATSDPDIFAAGDCCSFPCGPEGRRVRLESWRNAQDQGNHVAANMLGAGVPYGKAPWFWSDQYELTIQVAGLPDPGAPAVRRDLGEGAFVLFQRDAAGRLAAASGIGTGNAVARDIRLAEMLIERGARPDPAALVDPALNLKKLLRS